MPRSNGSSPRSTSSPSSPRTVSAPSRAPDVVGARAAVEDVGADAAVELVVTGAAVHRGDPDLAFRLVLVAAVTEVDVERPGPEAQGRVVDGHAVVAIAGADAHLLQRLAVEADDARADRLAAGAGRDAVPGEHVDDLAALVVAVDGHHEALARPGRAGDLEVAAVGSQACGHGGVGARSEGEAGGQRREDGDANEHAPMIRSAGPPAIGRWTAPRPPFGPLD